MQITKSGFYNLGENRENILNIGDNLNIIFFDDSNISRKINIGSNSRVEVYSFLNDVDIVNCEIKIIGENSNLKMGFLVFSNGKKIKSKIRTEIGSSNSKAKVKILSIVGNTGNIDIDGIMQINEGLHGVEGYLTEENLFIGNEGKIRGIPTLFVRSDDVKASHSCKIEKVSLEQLFYLRSRGIEKENALSMMLDSYIKSLYKCLKMIDMNLYNEKINKIINLIKS